MSTVEKPWLTGNSKVDIMDALPRNWIFCIVYVIEILQHMNIIDDINCDLLSSQYENKVTAISIIKIYTQTPPVRRIWSGLDKIASCKRSKPDVAAKLVCSAALNQ